MGLGNSWRITAVVGQNGGRGYLFTYLIAALVSPVRLLIHEIAVGRTLRHDVVAVYRSVRREFAVLG